MAAAGSFWCLHYFSLAYSDAVSADGPAKAGKAAILALLTVGKVLVSSMLLASAGLSYLARAKRRNLLRQAESQRSLEGITWQEFELLVGEAFRLKGYQVKELGGSGPDGGVDLVLTKSGEAHLVQCKQWRSLSVGVDVVRQIFGVMAAHGAAGSFVVTSGTFTSAAKDFAHGRNVVLIDGQQLMTMIADVRGKDASAQGTRLEGLPKRRPEPAVSRPEPSATSPVCPSCKGAMVKRISRNGAQPFWGCSSFPSCRGTRKL